MHIGVFDSGMGGLIVLRELKKEIPQARYSYLGDVARLPYGDKAFKTLKQYRHENMEFLESLQVDLILIACHSISSFSLELKKTKSGTPVCNMITPCGKEALEKSKNKRIGVIATQATVKTQTYPRFFKALDSRVQIFTKACPLLVPMIEKAIIAGPIVEEVLGKYLNPLIAEKIDSLLLGCSHYFILQKSLSRLLDPSIQLIHPALSVARSIKNNRKKVLESKTNFSTKKQKTRGNLTIYLTDHNSPFTEYCHNLFPDLTPDQIVYTSTLSGKFKTDQL